MITLVKTMPPDPSMYPEESQSESLMLNNKQDMDKTSHDIVEEVVNIMLG